MQKLAVTLRRGALLFLLWLILTAGAPQGWLAGGALSLLIAFFAPFGPALKLRYGRLFVFVFWFFAQSFLSGLDVARRALAPRPNLNPGVITYECAPLNSSGVRLFAALVSLMPGTLSMHIEGTALSVHVLDRCANPEAGLDALKTRVYGLFR